MDRFATHRRLAFDLDGTLIDGAASPTIARYIRAHPEKIYFIVTFRTPDQIGTLDQELLASGLDREQFERIVPMSRRLALEFEHDQETRRHSAMPMLGTDADGALPGEQKVMFWKGYVAKKLGATVLVDDMPYLSEPGCKRFGVALVDAARLAGLKESRMPHARQWLADENARHLWRW